MTRPAETQQCYWWVWYRLNGGRARPWSGLAASMEEAIWRATGEIDPHEGPELLSVREMPA